MALELDDDSFGTPQRVDDEALKPHVDLGHGHPVTLDQRYEAFLQNAPRARQLGAMQGERAPKLPCSVPAAAQLCLDGAPVQELQMVGLRGCLA